MIESVQKETNDEPNRDKPKAKHIPIIKETVKPNEKIFLQEPRSFLEIAD